MEGATRCAPDSAATSLELTRTRHDLAQWEFCAIAAEQTLAIEKDNTEAALMCALAYFAEQKHETATGFIERVAASFPDYTGVHIFHTRCLMARNLFGEAHGPTRRAAPRRGPGARVRGRPISTGRLPETNWSKRSGRKRVAPVPRNRAEPIRSPERSGGHTYRAGRFASHADLPAAVARH